MYICVGIKLHGMTLVRWLIEAGAGSGPNSVSKPFPNSTWTLHIKRQNALRPRGAIKQLISSKEVILLQLQIGDLHICIWFESAKIPAFELSLETSSIEIYIQVVFPAKRKLVLCLSQPVGILVPDTKIRNALTVADHIDSQPSSALVTDDI